MTDEQKKKLKWFFIIDSLLFLVQVFSGFQTNDLFRMLLFCLLVILSLILFINAWRVYGFLEIKKYWFLVAVIHPVALGGPVIATLIKYNKKTKLF